MHMVKVVGTVLLSLFCTVLFTDNLVFWLSFYSTGIVNGTETGYKHSLVKKVI